MEDENIGKRFGEWLILELDNKKYKSRGKRYMCKCSCGTIKSVFWKYLKSGKSISCGCLHKKDYTGQKFGKLTVLETLFGFNGNKRATYHCKCDCGNEVYVGMGSLLHNVSCGCSRRSENLDGQRFGKLIVTKTINEFGHESMCECLCDCGNTIITRRNSLLTGNTKSCGCIASPSLIGKKFGKLTVIEEVEGTNKQRNWLCECDCGNKIIRNSHLLTSGHTKSCGCARSENVSQNEVLISNILKENKVEYEPEKTFPNLKGIGGKSLRFDFFIPSKNTAIEYDGKQHFEPIEYFGGEENFQRQKQNDSIKNKFCKENNIDLVRIPYTYSTDKIKDTILAII